MYVIRKMWDIECYGEIAIYGLQAAPQVAAP